MTSIGVAALESGLLSEWRATILVKETAYLAIEDRTVIDAELCANPATLHGVGDKALEARAKTLAYQRDPHAVVERAAKAPKDRRVTSRPAPDCMASVNALLPVAQGVGIIAALRQAADFHHSSGDDRSRDQIMADVLFERVTGRATADGPPPSGSTSSCPTLRCQVTPTSRRTSRTTDPFPPRSRERWCPPETPGSNSAGSTQSRSPGPWWQWTRSHESSRKHWPP